MKKWIVPFLIFFLFFVSPVKASSYKYNYSNESVQYKLDEKETDEDSNSVFWGMLIVAFLAISIFLIAYKSDDDL